MKFSNASFQQRVIDAIKKIPLGRVATYGQIAVMAGSPYAARQVAWILHSCSGRYRLPWHRVINRFGRISLPAGSGGEEQRVRLRREGIRFSAGGVIDLRKYLWQNKAEI